MNITEEQLNEIETMAGLFFSVEDICTNLELDEEGFEYFKTCLELKRDFPFCKAYIKGRLGAEVELRQSIKQAAINGSNPAQSTLLSYFNQSKL